MDSKSFGVALISECERRLFEESLPRLKKCLLQLTEKEIWIRPNAKTVSVGNIVLHLCGNVRQWIIAALGDSHDIRVRSKEFEETGPLPKNDLMKSLDEIMDEVRSVLHRMNPTTLLERYSVQGFQETGISILVHVVEHFSYHVGQITYFVKSTKAIDLQYYEGIELNKTGGSDLDQK